MNFKLFLESKTQQELESLGYKFSVENNLPKRLTILCKKDLKWIGEAGFTQDKIYMQSEYPNWADVWHEDDDLKPGEMWVANVWVDPQHQRLGIASIIYQIAEKISGNKIIRTPARTADADALWNQSNRPFGRP